MSVRKIYSTATLALADVLRDDMTIMSGGFGLCGIPSVLIDAVLESGVRGLTIISNNPGAEGLGLGKLFNTRQVHKLICSYAGENAQFARQYMAGEVEVEFNPQGTLAERIRAGGAGIPAFYTRTGVGTVIAEGKPLAEFDGKTYLLERGLRADLALVSARLRQSLPECLLIRGRVGCVLAEQRLCRQMRFLRSHEQARDIAPAPPER